ncbi:MAG TPA: helicase-related protein, partial [Beutenbergiaceae bacterium]|nr:helicase-related protein [Beutenbergiaceae bacterium]
TPVMPNRLVFKEVEEAFSSEFVFADNKPWVSITQNPIRAAQILCGSLYTDPSDQLDLSDAEPLELLDLLRRHRFISLLIEHTEQAEDFNDLVQSLFPDYRGRERLRRGAGAFLLIMFSVLSQLRATCGRVALSVDVHLWIRELTRVDRIAGSDAPTFRWHDDGAATSQTAFPALYCRHCGRSGWGVVLAPTGPYLAHSDEEIRAERLRRNERFRPLLHVPAHDQAEQFTPQVSWFNTQARRVSVEEPDLVEVEEGTTIPVITHVGEEAGEKSLNDVCPSCGAKDAIRFLGSAVATQLSVALGALFGAEGLKEEEKKALVFTDSVQDAAHRAGFVGARSHVFTLRSLMRDYIDTDHITLDRLADALVREAGSDAHARHRLLSPDIAEREAFRSFWQDPSRLPQALRERVRRRLSFDVGLEFGLRTTVGRTLEATTTVAVGVAFTNPEIINAAKAALDQAGVAQLVSGVDETTLVRWVRAIMMHMRLRGAIDHPWWNSYRKHEGNRWFLGGGRRRDEGMPGFRMRQSVPAFPYVGRISRKDSEFEPIASERGWYAGWTAKCLEHGRAEAATIVTLLFKELAKRGMVGTFDTIGGATTFHLVPDAIRVQATSVDDAAEGRLAVACNACGSLTRGIPYFVDALVGGPCLVHRCAGVLTRLPQGDNYYRQMYMARDPKRVVAREHTALLPTDVRLEYETQFKQASDNPAAPNVLVATPTLEMGIDIGDLSTVMLSSLPKTVASYVQRVGRAGRLTGNALTVAFVTARGSQLPLFHRPQRVINGQVNPPATYLDAVEILRRQYLAFVVDHLARAGAVSPGRAVDVFALENPEGFLPQVIDTAEQPDMVEAFIAAFPHANPDVMAELRAWTQTEHPHESALATRCKTVAHAFNVELENLRHREREILEVIGPLQQRAELPAASIQDKEDYGIAESALKQTRSLIKGRTRQHWVAALEAAGLLPNYTLIDDSVELNVSLSWFDPETERYANESFNLDRASAQALREFA